MPIASADMDDTLREPDHLEAIGFSQCGKFYTVKFKSQTWPAIFPLPIESDALHPNVAEPQHRVLPRKRKAEDESVQGTWPNSLALMSGLPMLQANKVSINKMGSQTTSTIVVPKHAPQKLEIHFSASVEGTASNVSYNLVSLPNNVDLNHTTTTISWPSDPEGKIRIILSNDSPRFYDATNIFECQPAIVIDRDPRSLQRVENALVTQEQDAPPLFLPTVSTALPSATLPPAVRASELG
jgi:hypothetical protein